jgi:hypothetical protein
MTANKLLTGKNVVTMSLSELIGVTITSAQK